MPLYGSREKLPDYKNPEVLERIYQETTRKLHYISFDTFIECYPIFKTLAKYNHAASQWHLGIMHYFGYGTHGNLQEAFKCFQKSASQDDPDAHIWLGHMYARAPRPGLRFPFQQDLDKALACYQRAQELKVPDAKHHILFLAPHWKKTPEDERKFLKLLHQCEKDKTFNNACNRATADIYIRNSSIPKWVSVNWIFKTANSGVDAARGVLSDLYRNNIFIERDYDESAYWSYKEILKGDMNHIEYLTNLLQQRKLSFLNDKQSLTCAHAFGLVANHYLTILNQSTEWRIKDKCPNKTHLSKEILE